MIQKGVYKHYKGTLYKVLDIAYHSETEEEHVIYHSLNNPNKLWIRPSNMFNEKIKKNGIEQSRFELVNNE